VTKEGARLRAEDRKEPEANWKRWGTYLAERQWGTVREDFSTNAFPWTHFTHDDATWRTYRWGEDGILGWSDRQGRLCFALSFWNGVDPILKERLYGLTGPEGNHGEDVKECYFHLDATPTHSYCKGLYKYPQSRFPYDEVRIQNQSRNRQDLEYELIDTGIFDQDRYFDIFVEYAKSSPDDMLIRVTIHNRGDKKATLHALPTLWFRNTWAWKEAYESKIPKPKITAVGTEKVLAEHQTLGSYHLYADVDPLGKRPKWIFTENETNAMRAQGNEGSSASCKDAFHQYVVQKRISAVNPRPQGTKAAAVYKLDIPAKGSVELRLRLTSDEVPVAEPFAEGFNEVFKERIADADEFYAKRVPANVSEDQKRVLRQANAGLLWTKQFYYYAVDEWLKEAPERVHAYEWVERNRNSDWSHLFNRDVLSMPDKWEYPWFAAWDSAFHMIPFANIDPYFAKEQLILFLREWYMHPNGQIPAYEWNFSDVNPPVHAWSCWRVYQITKNAGFRDREFLARCFQKLLLNFTWWVNRKDVRGRHVFTGGFLGLDNIGIFDRSKPLPTGGHLEQADGTAWMAYYCSSMLSIAFELADGNPAYEDMASKFFEHYMNIAAAMNASDGTGLWDEQDGFYYDHLHIDGKNVPLRIRSIVGIVPLFTVDILFDRVVTMLPGFQRRMKWFLENRKDVIEKMTYMEKQEGDAPNTGLRLLAIPTRQQLERILRYVLDENEFLSPYGIRSLSKFHEKNPFVFNVHGNEMRVQYVPGESDTGMFGGNSNWRGPVWFPLNYILIEAFERYHMFYGDELRVECPTGSGQYMNLKEVADEIRRRLISLFLLTDKGQRPCYARGERFLNDPNWKDLILFYEYFHGDSGRGLGASHQTGWTALIAPIIEQLSSVDT
jgi:hypothetical protein